MTAREKRGLEMAKGIGRRNEPDVSIQRMNKLTYKVKSQSEAGKWYTVIKQYGRAFGDDARDGQWTCDCPDSIFRKVTCKHVHAVLFSKLLRKKVYQDTFPTPINQNVISANKLGQVVCQRCGSSEYKKNGIRHNKKAGEIQTYSCLECNYRFVVNPAFENCRASAAVVSNSIDLYMKGVSLRKISDHIKQSTGIDINYSSICRWIRKFNKVVQPYVDSFVPSQVGGVYHVDEMLVHVRKEKNDMNMNLANKENHTHRKFDNHYSWLWNLCDSTTRLWICGRISQDRTARTAAAVFKEMKQRAPLPKAIIHDGLNSYEEAFQREIYNRYSPQIMNVRSIGSNENGLQPKIERLNGTVRDREVVMRGMDNAKAAQELIDAMRLHYNFIRQNQAIGGQTPAEAAGINLNLGQNKVESLMRQAAVFSKTIQQEPIIKGLGIRANKLQVLHEGDCIRIKQKEWLDLKNWREINDVLRVQGFCWLSQGKDSCWIRMIK
jgi:transposase-like protein